VYLPTVKPDGSPTSAFPSATLARAVPHRVPRRSRRGRRHPRLGVRAGPRQIASGELKQVSGVAPHELQPGESWTLDDGTKLEFLGTRAVRDAGHPVRPDAAAGAGGAVLGLLGLMLSLAGHRRRVWFRACRQVERGGTVMEAGGLPRTDYPGFGDEFRPGQAGREAAEEGTP
jgi:cytochrome c biogenesis protein